MNGLLTHRLSLPLRKKLIKAGIIHLDFSLVSSKRELREKLRRKEETKKILSFANFMAKNKIPTTVHFIVGFPNQSFKEAIKDVKFLSKQRVFLGPSIFYPVIESELFEELKNKFSIKENDYQFFRSSCVYFDKSISRNQIFFIFYLSRIINFIKKIVDAFSLNQDNFFTFLERKISFYSLKDNTLVSSKKIDKLILGIIILVRLLKEKKIFRVEEKKENNKFIYSFLEEDFINSFQIEKFFKNLFLRSLEGVPLHFKNKRAHSSLSVPF
jgi:hypothetical protein